MKKSFNNINEQNGGRYTNPASWLAVRSLMSRSEKFIKLFTLFALSAITITGCSLESAATRPSMNVSGSSAAQIGAESSNAGLLLPEADSLSQEGVIRAGDKIQLTVWGYPKFNTTTTVDEYGTITIPLVGQVIVAGLTVRQLVAELKQRLSQYVRGNVRLALSHIGTDEQVSVMGAVSRQGNYSALTQRSLVDVLAEAGGTTTDADLNSIKIYRRGTNASEQTVNLTEYLRTGNVQYVPRVGPGDVVYVPQRPNFIRDFSTYASEVVFLFGFFALLR